MAKLKLRDYNPAGHPLCKNRDEALEMTAGLQKELYDLLYLMFAHGKHSLLIILHGIDTAGKDGTVRHIFNGANPQGIKVFSFKKPSLEEFRHDFLWRCHLQTPESGLAAIFNRSYYEEVTTAMVHPKFLKEQHIPHEILNRPDFFNLRYARINDFEKLLVQKGTVVVKFFLHISKKEQKLRIDARLKDRTKNWKFSIDDVKERKYWDEYMDSYSKMLTETSTKHAEWIIVPADNKWYRNYVVSKTLVETLRKLKMNFPKAQR
ncbi:MAG: polyphosphate kinase 2 family protein [Bdellovibrionaceae bacterium]|nr:polyphosphate kinase 2 family protein [Bdellovibrio sp.]